VLISQGRVTVNGSTITTLGTQARATDKITVDGKPLPRPKGPVYVVLNKPVGVVTTAHDPEGRPTVVDLVPRSLGRLFPVGRLDVQSSGLVLLTNDGALAERLAHPRHHVPRTYRVKVRGTPDEAALTRLRRGVRLEDGRTAPARALIEARLPTKSWLRLVVYEGKPHLVRRMCAAIGHPVDKLERIGLGALEIGRLARGAARHLTAAEVAALKAGRAPRTSPRAAARGAARQRRAAPARR
jgi:23S rRNA pseudouridine2605 synthase